MGLRDTAEADLATILEDDVTGFGWSLTVTDPAGLSDDTLKGSAGNVAALIDPDTGQLVVGQRLPVTLRVSSLAAVGLGVPVAIADPASKPWRVDFLNIDGTLVTGKVAEALPDLTLGVVTCLLEHYKAPAP